MLFWKIKLTLTLIPYENFVRQWNWAKMRTGVMRTGHCETMDTTVIIMYQKKDHLIEFETYYW